VRACLFGTYDRGHSANRLLRQALAGAGLEVVELHEPLWEETRTRTSYGAASPARLAMRYAAAPGGRAALAGVWDRRHSSWSASVAADALLARRVCRPRRGLVFAPLVSLSETLVEDRAVFRAGRPVARALAALDRAALRAADLVLADTAAHADYLVELGEPRGRVAVWHLGFEPEFLPPPAPAPAGRRVLFYGSYLPLHGIGTIVEAAARLGERAEFVLIGGGPERPAIEALARRRGAPVVFRGEVPLAALPGELAAAAVVLGVFGASRKAAMVVPNKVYQAAAAGRPLVTRDGPALREVLRPDEHCLACAPADRPRSPLPSHGSSTTALAERLGCAARAHVLEHFAPERQAARLGALVAARVADG
jgi:glycosyltransferase involved in cell wall biosynthesis